MYFRTCNSVGDLWIWSITYAILSWILGGIDCFCLEFVRPDLTKLEFFFESETIAKYKFSAQSMKAMLIHEKDLEKLEQILLNNLYR